MVIFVFDAFENIVGKGENDGYQHFLLFPQCFQKSIYSGSLKVVIVRYRRNLHYHNAAKNQGRFVLKDFTLTWEAQIQDNLLKATV